MVLDLPQPTPILNDEGEDIAEPFTTIPFSKLAPIEEYVPPFLTSDGSLAALTLCSFLNPQLHHVRRRQGLLPDPSARYQEPRRAPAGG